MPRSHTPASPQNGDDHRAALEQYRRRAAVYDAELALFEPVRRRAIDLLAPRSGETVLDAGCGTGLSFESLLVAVGAQGAVVGVEQSPAMLAKAHERVQAHRWNNISLVCAAGDAAQLPAAADAALFMFTHDLVRDERALENLIGQLKPGARVVAAGLQWAPWWAWPANLFVWPAALYSVTSLEGLAAPWSRLDARLGPPRIEPMLGGAVYVASGWRVPRR